MLNVNSTNLINFKAKPVPQNVIEKTKSELLDDKVKDVDIYCHYSPDEDTVNCAKVFSNWLTAHNKTVNICVPKDEISKLYIDTKKYNLKHDNKNADKTVILDFSDENRIPDEYKTLCLASAPNNILGFDHHISGENKINGIYVDDTARSCCSILSRFFDGMNIQPNKEDLKSLYCGMVSDYKKSKLINITKNGNTYEIEQTNNLKEDKNAKEVFDNIDKRLDTDSKQEVLKHLDLLANLTPEEKEFQKNIFENVQVSTNGKLAYVAISPDDNLWEKVGMDNPTTSEILKDFRIKTLENNSDKKLKDVNTAIVFYRKSKNSNEYKLSIHSKNNSAIKLLEEVNKNYDDKFICGGHEDRAGGKLIYTDTKETDKLVSDFVKASEIL